MLSKFAKNLLTLNPQKKPTLPPEIISTLVGITLGDGHLQTQNKGKTFRLLAGQGGSGVLGEAHRNYLYHLYDIFSDFCYKKPRKLIREDSLSKAPRWVFHTIATPEFNGVTKQFYKPLNSFPPDLRLILEKQGQRQALRGEKDRFNPLVKVCPSEIVDLLDERALAYWYMDDGSQKDRKSGAAILNTQAFTLSDCLLLCEAL